MPPFLFQTYELHLPKYILMFNSGIYFFNVMEYVVPCIMTRYANNFFHKVKFALTIKSNCAHNVEGEIK